MSAAGGDPLIRAALALLGNELAERRAVVGHPPVDAVGDLRRGG